MTEPSPAELLAGVAEALEKTVLPDLERGPIRNQVMAAIGIVRRCGGAIDRYGPFLHADCADLIATLRQASGADPALVVDSTAQSFDDVTGAADGVLDAACPQPSALAKAHTDLSNQLAAMLLRAQQTSSGQMPVLRQLLERMTAREQELGLSPWRT